MKLRNKKTGEIKKYYSVAIFENALGDGLGEYHTLTELNGEWEDYTPEPDPSYLIAKIQKLENSVKELNRKMDIFRDAINELDKRLKTVEESTERLLREDNEQNSDEVKQYRLELPPRVAFERMKQDLRDWIEKNKINCVQTFIHTEPDGRRGVRFFDITNAGDNHLVIIGWPAIGLVDGAEYTPDELLITGEAGKEC